ncbi:hypothetical protein BAA13334_II00375 [Brucella abortus A13334]|nr:hypothetical protein BAA13334_II00375 [Brucella abortus A13334]
MGVEPALLHEAAAFYTLLKKANALSHVKQATLVPRMLR